MSFENRYPYTDFHELNLDWFLQEFNKVMKEWDDVKREFSTLETTVNDFIDFVNNYFDNLDVQEEINNKLDKMASDGTLTALLMPYFNDFKSDILGIVGSQNTRITTLESRMDSFVHLEDGSTSGDAELQDIRIGYDGHVYNTAGDAVRGQIEQVLDDLYELPEYLGYTITELAQPVNTGKYMNTNTGVISNIAREGFAVSDYTLLPDGAKMIVLADTPVTNSSILIIGFYRTNSGGFISGVIPAGQNLIIRIPAEAKYYVVSSNVNSVGTTYPLNTRLLVANNENIVKIKTTDKYDLIVGDTFEMFYDGIIESYLNNKLYMDINCSKGAGFEKKFIYTPTTTGNIALNAVLYNEYLESVDSKNITLSVHTVPSNPGSVKNVLCVGDSLTVHGEWVKEFKRRLTGTGGTPAGYNLSNIHFIGTCSEDGANYEGYGGYTFTSYNTANISADVKMITCSGHDKTEADDQHSIYRAENGSTWKLETINSGTIKIIKNSGTSSTFPTVGELTWVSGGVNHSSITYTASENASGNPFWNPNAGDDGAVDFANYASNLGVSSIDYVFVLLGWNSAAAAMSTIKNTAQTFIDNIQADFPSAKIVLMGLEHPSKDGCAANYGSTGTYSRYLNLIKYVHDLDDMFDELVFENSNVYHINISGQFDTEHNMQQGTRPVNTRNSETEIYQTNGIHPANSGLLQIADAATRAFAGI